MTFQFQPDRVFGMEEPRELQKEDDVEKQLSAGEQKALEYVQRIQAGESKEEIFKDLPESFRRSIEDQLNEHKKEATPDDEAEVVIPAQYEGLSADIVEELWTIPIYVDEGKNDQEKRRKQKIIELLKQREKSQTEKKESQTEEREKLEEVKRDLGISKAKKSEENKNDAFGSFKVSNGETDIGAWWYEYRNQIAKEMKKDGKFEWGKERVYFDIPLADMVKMRDLMMMVASEEKVPIAFKHLDEEKTFPTIKDGTETRFVANFASPEDALRFYMALRKHPEYQSFHTDRNMNYGGYRVDEIAEYANGYRENRDALKRIMGGAFNERGKWEWNGSVQKHEISKEEYELFKKQFEELNTKILRTQQEWEDALKK